MPKGNSTPIKAGRQSKNDRRVILWADPKAGWRPCRPRSQTRACDRGGWGGWGDTDGVLFAVGHLQKMIICFGFKVYRGLLPVFGGTAS